MSLLARNKKLVVLGLAGLSLTCCGFFGLAFGGANATLKSSGAYSTGLARAVADARVRLALGAPLTPGWMVTGKVETSAAGSWAQLTVPLEGALRTGTLHLEARSAGGEWTFVRLEVKPAGTPPINLLE